jgi:hypothetical protein
MAFLKNPIPVLFGIKHLIYGPICLMGYCVTIERALVRLVVKKGSSLMSTVKFAEGEKELA